MNTKLRPFWKVMFCMIRPICKFKVFDSIVCLYSVFVMDNLIRTKFAFQFFFHKTPMFKTISSITRMLRMKNKHITTSSNVSPSFPVVWMWLRKTTRRKTVSFSKDSEKAFGYSQNSHDFFVWKSLLIEQFFHKLRRVLGFSTHAIIISCALLVSIPAVAADTYKYNPFTNNLDNTGSGGGSGDVTSVGDCTTGACFDGTTGTTLTFNNAGGDGVLAYDGTNFTLDHSPKVALASANITIDSSSGASVFVDRGSNSLPNNALVTYQTAGSTNFSTGTSGVLHNGSSAYYSVIDASGNELWSIQDQGSTGDVVVSGDETISGGDLTIGSAHTIGSTGVVFNEAGADMDFRVESDNEANMLTIDAGLDQVQFGNATTTISKTGTILNDLGTNDRNVQSRLIVFPVTSTIASTTTTTGQNCAGDTSFQVPAYLDNFKVTTVIASVTSASTSGTLTMNIRNRTDGTNILSTALTIDANERSSTTAATPAVINPANALLSTNDDICVQVSDAATGNYGLQVTAEVIP